MNIIAIGTRITKDMKYSVFLNDLLVPFLSIIALLFFLLLNYDFKYFISSIVLVYIISFLVAFYLYNTLFYSKVRDVKTTFITNKLLIFSIPLFAVNILGIFNTWVDTLMIGHFLDTSEVGIYRAAVQISLIITLVLSAVNSIFTPMIADLFNRKKIDELKELFIISTKWALYISIPIFLFIIDNSKELLGIVFGNEYIEGSSPLIILAVASVINVSTGGVGALITMSGNQKYWFYNTLAMFVVNLILNIILIPSYGLIGAAIATGISMSSIFILGIIEVTYLLKIWLFELKYFKPIIAGTVSYLLVLIVNNFYMRFFPSQIIVNGLIVVMSFYIILLLIGLDEEDSFIFNKIKNKVMNMMGN